MLNRYAEAIIRYRWLVIIATLLAVFAAAKGAANLAFTTDYRVFFASDNPQLEAFETLQSTYDKSDNVTFVITPKDGNVFTPQTLSSIQWLTEEAWQTPYSTRVDSVTNFQHTVAEEDDLIVGDLVEDPKTLTPAQLRELSRIAQSEPQLHKRLISPDDKVTGVNINIQMPGMHIREVPEVAEFVRNLADQLRERDSNLEVRLSGIVMMNNAFGESSEADMATLVPLMFLIVLVVLVVLLRSITGTLGTVIVILMSILTAMGLFGWGGYKLTAPTASAPTIILTMAVADCVHLLVSFLWNMRHGKNKHDAMVEAIRINMMPIFLTSLTTVLGFMTMNFSEVPPLAHLGNLVAVGVIVAFILSVSFLPALMMVLPVRVKQAKEGQSIYLERLAEWVIGKRKPLLWGMTLVAIFFVSFIPNNEINDEFVKYFDKSVEFRVDSDYASEHLLGPYTIEYSLEAGSEGAISEPKYLAKVAAFVDYLYGFDEVSHVFTLTDTMQRLNKNMHGDDGSWYKLPEQRDLAAQYLLLYEMSLPYGLDLNNQIDVGKSATRVTVSMVNLSSNQVLELEEIWGQWLATHAPELNAKAASPNLMFAHIGYRNAHSMVFGTAIALFCISLVLVFALRSVRVGLISLVPNLIPVGIAFGLWGLMDGQIGMSVSIVAAMTLGIVVDDTVHFLSKYLRARREKGYDAYEATRYAFTHVGQALVVTTLVLVAGFLVLSGSTFKMNADMGLLTAMTIAIALIIDFLLLPPLLMKLDGQKSEKLSIINQGENDVQADQVRHSV